MHEVYITNIPDFVIRPAKSNDIKLVLNFIKKLAEYEGLLSEVSATEDVLFDSLFNKHQAEVIIGEYRAEPVAFALFFQNFSTFLGKGNLYLEDLFVNEACRGRGFGRAMFACVARIAVEKGCGRLDWWCLDWNEASIAFYKRMGARPMSDWTVYRVDGQNLIDLAHTLGPSER